MHYLIVLDENVVGIISGASAVYAVRSRDEYFGLTKENKKVALNCIVNNTVFRLEKHLPNLATQVLAMWRRQVAKDWEDRYGVAVHGFETFVIENDTRKGTVYKADNWDYIGETSGSTKTHKGMETKHERKSTVKKLIFVKKVKGTELCREYHATWRTKGSKKKNRRLKSELMQIHEDNIYHLNQQLFNSAISTAYTNNSHVVGDCDVLSPAYIS